MDFKYKIIKVIALLRIYNNVIALRSFSLSSKKGHKRFKNNLYNQRAINALIKNEYCK